MRRLRCAPRGDVVGASRLPRRAHRLVIHAQQQPDPRERDDHARAAVAHQRQRQALGRQHAHVHADVDERLHAEPQAEAGGEIRLELAGPRRAASRAI